MKLAIITSNHLRHRYFVDKLSQKFSVVGVFIEQKKRDYSQKGVGTEHENSVKKYFADREKSEVEFFGDTDWDSVCNQVGEVEIVEAGYINEEKHVSKLCSWKPDYLAVFGSSILKDNIINLFPNRIINMHLGLSPYYRGSGTNFWPLYDEKPEYVGVTIHYLDKGIDSGRIIVQGRPDIELNDTPHSIGNKTITKGVELVVETLKRLKNGESIPGVNQNLLDGKLCLFKNCLPEHILELEEKFNNHLVESYLQRIKNNLNYAPKIVEFVQ